MTGENVKRILLSKGMKISDVADRLGESLPNTSAMFKVQDIKTGVLERISSACDIPLSEFYGIAPFNIASGDNNTQIAGNGNTVNANVEKLIDSLSKKDEQIDRLLSIIERLQHQSAETTI